MCTHLAGVPGSFIRCALFVLLAAPAAHGQGLGTIVGTVTDSSGAVVPGATVTVTLSATGIVRTGLTNAQGYYTISSLPPSEYQVDIKLEGFRNFSRKGVTLQADQSLTLNATLEVGGAAETITVVGQPPQVDTTSGTLTHVVDQQRMVDMPLNGRNAATLTMLTPGVVPTAKGSVDQGPTKTFPTGITISSNGSKQSQISWNLDGGNNADIQTNINQPFPFPDALQEFSVQTSNYSARYGTNAGGVVNVITKSGTNQFHGSAFEFLRDAMFNARNAFAADVDKLKRNQFGGTTGGPIRSGKTFFFAGYQGTLLRNTSTKSATLPTIANVTRGDFSALLDPNSPDNPSPGKSIKIIDPATGQPFPNNIIPVRRFDPAAMKVMSMLRRVGGNGQIQSVLPDQQNVHEFLGRVDHDMSSRDRLTARYFYDQFNAAAQFDPTNIITYSDSAKIVSQNVLFSETHTFGPTALNEMHFGLARVRSERLPPADAPTMTSLGVNMYDGGISAIQDIQVQGAFMIGGDPPSTFTRNAYRLNEDLSWNHGRHVITLGGSVEWDFYNVRNTTNIVGDFRFNANVTKWAPAAFLLGQINQLTQGSGQFVDNRNIFYGVYIQDDFHVARRLTLNLGLRYDPFSPWHDLKGVEQFSPGAYAAGTTSRVYTNAPKGLLFPGDPGVPEWGYNGNYTNISPRVGFAYDLSGDGTTSLRGGAGIFYDAHYAAINGQMWNSNTPFSTQQILTQPRGPFSDPYRGITNPFPVPVPAPHDYVFPTPVSAYGYDPSTDFVLPRYDTWNLSLERQVAPQWLVRLGYVGSRGKHLSEYVQVNPAVYIPGSRLGVDQRRNYQPYSLVGFYEQDVTSAYDALQVSVEKRLSRGFTILANYTLARSVDDTPANQPAVAMNVNLPNLSTLPFTDPARHVMDYGPSDFERRHRFVVSYVWSLPGPTGRNQLLRAVTGRWQLSGIVTAHSGDPLTVLAGLDQSQTALNADRAVLVGSPYGTSACGSTTPCVSYLDPGAFQIPAPGTFGTMRKGQLRGPGYFNSDIGLHKSFTLNGRTQLQFRAEYFNVFNRVNYNDPNLGVSGGGFGQILSAQDPRIGQLSLKLTF